MFCCIIATVLAQWAPFVSRTVIACAGAAPAAFVGLALWIRSRPSILPNGRQIAQLQHQGSFRTWIALTAALVVANSYIFWARQSIATLLVETGASSNAFDRSTFISGTILIAGPGGQITRAIEARGIVIPLEGSSIAGAILLFSHDESPGVPAAQLQLGIKYSTPLGGPVYQLASPLVLATLNEAQASHVRREGVPKSLLEALLNQGEALNSTSVSAGQSFQMGATLDPSSHFSF